MNALHDDSPTLTVELRRLTRLAWPVALGQIGMVLMGTVDTLMVGELGAGALASVTLGNTWSFGLLIFAFGCVFGLDPLLGQAHGAGDADAYARRFGLGTQLLAIVLVPVMALHLAVRAGLTLVSQPAELIPVAGDYADAVLPGLPAAVGFFLVRQGLQARGHMTAPMIVALAANVVNVGANLVFLHGVGSWEGLGPAGVGWSTSLVRWLMFGTLLLVADDERRGLARALTRRPSLAGLRHTAGVAIPVGFQYALEVWGFLSVTVVMGWFGERALAGHTVALNLTSLAFMIPLGLSAAASTRVSNLVGAGRPVDRAAWTAVGMGCAVMFVSGAVFATFPEPLGRLYLPDDAEAVAVVVALLPLAAVFQVFDGAQCVLFGVLRGVGDTRLPLLANVFGYYVVGLPVGVLLATRGALGPAGLWIGLTLALAVVSALLTVRLLGVLRRGTVALADPAAG